MPNSTWEHVLATSENSALEELFELLRIPSVSTDPARRYDVRRTAAWVAARLTTAGLPEVEIVEGTNGGHPAVIGRWHSEPGQPSVRWPRLRPSGRTTTAFPRGDAVELIELDSRM